MNNNQEINKTNMKKQYDLACEILRAYSNKENKELAVNNLKGLAELGYIPAQIKLGESYEYGLFTDQNYDAAFYYYSKAAELEDADSQFKIGSFFWQGKGIKMNFEQALSWFIKSAENGNNMAQYQVGYMYQNGIGTNIDYEKALYWLQEPANKGIEDAICQLGFLHLYGNGVKQNFLRAKELFNRSVKSIKSKDSSIKYYTKLFNTIRVDRIQVVENITEPIDNSTSAVLIKPDKNIDVYSHSLYDIDTFNKIKGAANKLLSDIEDVKPDRSNEFEVFQQICRKIAIHISYDNEAIHDYSEKRLISRNLIGALSQGSCICSGDSETLRNLCALKGIECITVRSYNHSFNQVKIQGIWYFIDITQNRYNIRKGKSIDRLLQSKQDFLCIDSSDEPDDGKNIYPSHEPLKGEFIYPSLVNFIEKSDKINANEEGVTDRAHRHNDDRYEGDR